VKDLTPTRRVVRMVLSVGGNANWSSKQTNLIIPAQAAIFSPAIYEGRAGAIDRCAADQSRRFNQDRQPRKPGADPHACFVSMQALGKAATPPGQCGPSQVKEVAVIGRRPEWAARGITYVQAKAGVLKRC